MDLRLKTLLLVGTLLNTLPAWSFETQFAPAYCEPEQHRLEVENRTPFLQRLWTQVRVGDEFLEQAYDIPASGKITLDVADFTSERRAFTLRPFQENSLRVTSVCGEKTRTVLSKITSPQVSHYLPRGISRVHLHLLNLFLQEQKIQITAVSATGQTLAQEKVWLKNYYDTELLDWNIPEGTSRLDVQGTERLSSLLFFDAASGWLSSPAVAVQPVVLNPAPDKVYFLMAAKNSNLAESFVVGMDDPEMIATARQQIKNPSLEKIMIAGIELGNGNYNRSFSTTDRAPYSWSVNRVDAFGDLASVSCNGSPDLTEERLAKVLYEGGGRICFWRYRILRELSTTEIAVGQLNPTNVP